LPFLTLAPSTSPPPYCYVDPRALHSFPTRRSSDLDRGHAAIGKGDIGDPVEVLRRVDHSPVLEDEIVAHVFLDSRTRGEMRGRSDRKSTRLNSSHVKISYAVFCLKKKISNVRLLIR